MKSLDRTLAAECGANFQITCHRAAAKQTTQILIQAIWKSTRLMLAVYDWAEQSGQNTKLIRLCRNSRRRHAMPENCEIMNFWMKQEKLVERLRF